jgi:hypothetical protein
MPPAVMLGGPGNDDLTLLITNPGTGLTINNFLDGGFGIDDCTRTTNVIGVDMRRDQVSELARRASEGLGEKTLAARRANGGQGLKRGTGQGKMSPFHVSGPL